MLLDLFWHTDDNRIHLNICTMGADKTMNAARSYAAPVIRVFGVKIDTIICGSPFGVVAVREGETDFMPEGDSEDYYYHN